MSDRIGYGKYEPDGPGRNTRCALCPLLMDEASSRQHYLKFPEHAGQLRARLCWVCTFCVDDWAFRAFNAAIRDATGIAPRGNFGWMKNILIERAFGKSEAETIDAIITAQLVRLIAQRQADERARASEKARANA